MNRLPRESYNTQQLLRVGTQRLSGRGQSNVSRVAGEELHAKRILQGAYARTNRWLAHPQRRGGAVKAAVCNHRQKRFHLIDFHSGSLKKETQVTGRVYWNR